MGYHVMVLDKFTKVAVVHEVYAKYSDACKARESLKNFYCDEFDEYMVLDWIE